MAKQDRTGIRKAIKNREESGGNLHRVTLVETGGRHRMVEAQCNSIAYTWKRANLYFIRDLSESGEEKIRLPHA